MRALVTGCAGFIGSHLCEHLLAAGWDVVGVDAFTDYYSRGQKEANLKRVRDERRFHLQEADLAEADLTRCVEGVDVVYHQAAQPGVRASWGSSFEVYARNNVVATQRLLEAVKGCSLRKFVYASSSSVYGDAESLPTCESVLPRPVSPYGVTKLSGEQLVYLYWRNYGVPTISLRYFTVYGPRQRPDMAFHRFIRCALAGEPIQIYGDGEQTRDFTFISDAIAANVAAAMRPAEGLAVNVGGGSRVQLNQVIRMLGEVVDREVAVSHVGTQYGDVRHTSADTRLAADVLGYVPRVDLATGLAAEVEWIKSHHLRKG